MIDIKKYMYILINGDLKDIQELLSDMNKKIKFRHEIVRIPAKEYRCYLEIPLSAHEYIEGLRNDIRFDYPNLGMWNVVDAGQDMSRFYHCETIESFFLECKLLQATKVDHQACHPIPAPLYALLKREIEAIVSDFKSAFPKKALAKRQALCAVLHHLSKHRFSGAIPVDSTRSFMTHALYDAALKDIYNFPPVKEMSYKFTPGSIYENGLRFNLRVEMIHLDYFDALANRVWGKNSFYVTG